jgi:citrate synthase
MSKLAWRTALSKVEPGHIAVRGYDIADLIRRASFGDMVYLLFKGEWPQRREGELIEAILVSSCDHSLAAPSADATRLVASGGVPLPSAVAAGLLAVGEYHGGAIERCAQMLLEAMQGVAPGENDFTGAANRLVATARSKGERVPGYGHPVHPEDPRVAPLFELAAELGLSGRRVTFARTVERVLREQTGRPLPINVDGAIAALLLEMEFDWHVGKAFFLISRSVGLSAHYLEQITREAPFKAADYEEIVYDGPGARQLPES